jgi:hypothetical protein
LVLVGIGGIWIAVRALKPTKDAAEAALANAQAVINSERPWLVVMIEPIEDIPGMYVVRAVNKGRTPAQLYEGHCSCKLHPVDGFTPPDEIRDPFFAPMSYLTVSGDAFDIRKITPESQIGEEDRKGGGIYLNMLYVYGKLLYWGVLANRADPTVKPYLTQWCFGYDPCRKIFYRTAGEYTRNT